MVIKLQEYASLPQAHWQIHWYLQVRSSRGSLQLVGYSNRASTMIAQLQNAC